MSETKRRIKTAVIGIGGRGNTYLKWMTGECADRFEITAICDINRSVLEKAEKDYRLRPEQIFDREETFFEEKRADLLVITTQDRDHLRMAEKAMLLGYDLLLEKPIAVTREDCLHLLDMQKRLKRRVFVCHVLRYAGLYLKADELLKKGMIGKLVSMTDLEQVWYAHYVHSYVRGSWRRSEDSSPMILAKCSHDLDLLQHFAGAKCDTVSSVGRLTHFKAENAPEGSTQRCLDCPHVDTCPFSAKRFYIDRLAIRPDYVFSNIIVRPRPLTIENLMNALRTGPYGRCAYRCDNDVVDQQLTQMRFENGVTASLDMNAFTGNGGRILRLHGTKGEIVLDEEQDTVTLKLYGREEHDIWPGSELMTSYSGHSGGDLGIVTALYRMLTGEQDAVTALEDAVESHLMAFSAEESRLCGGKTVKVHEDRSNGSGEGTSGS